MKPGAAEYLQVRDYEVLDLAGGRDSRVATSLDAAPDAQRYPSGPSGASAAKVANRPCRTAYAGSMSKSSVVHVDRDILGGTPVFVGTRVPFRALIDYLEAGHSLDEFLDDFPTVSRELAVAALEAAHEAVAGRAGSP